MAEDQELKRRSEDPSTTCDAYQTMLPRLALMDALLGGTEAMRAAGETYLPRHQEEKDIGYADRLASAVLFNVTEHTLGSLVGRPFRSDPEIRDDTPPAVGALLDDIDMQGNAIGPVARDWFQGGLSHGFYGMLVEQPVKDERVKTKEDERVAGLRPYWIPVAPSNILDAQTETIGGVEKLVHLRILEEYQERVGFASVTKHRIRVLEPGTVQTFDEVKSDDGKKVTWTPGEVIPVEMDEIPFVIWYSTKREGNLLCKPRLLDLAELNKCHWQSSADQRHILTVGRFPILACSGASAPTSTGGEPDSAGIIIGPDKIVYIPDAAGRLYYVEHTGAAIEAGRKDLEDLERQMAQYGSQFLAERPGDQTATAAAIDTAQSTSELAGMTRSFEDAVAKAFYYTAKWLGIAGGSTGGIKLSTDWNAESKQAAKDASKQTETPSEDSPDEEQDQGEDNPSDQPSGEQQ